MDINQLISFGLDEAKAKDLYNKIEKYILGQLNLKTKEYEEKLLEEKLKMAVERQLFMAKAKNIKATMALIDFTKLDKKNIDEKAIRQLIDELKNNEETKFLFEEDEVKITGIKPFEAVNKNINKRQLSYEELCNYYERGIY